MKKVFNNYRSVQDNFSEKLLGETNCIIFKSLTHYFIPKSLTLKRWKIILNKSL